LLTLIVPASILANAIVARVIDLVRNPLKAATDSDESGHPLSFVGSVQ